MTRAQRLILVVAMFNVVATAALAISTTIGGTSGEGPLIVGSWVLVVVALAGLLLAWHGKRLPDGEPRARHFFQAALIDGAVAAILVMAASG